MRDIFKTDPIPRPDDSDGGGYICNQCTPKGSSGFDLLTLVFGYSFTESVNQVSALLELSDGGGYICNQCTPKGSSGFDLLTLVFGYSFTESVNQVSALLELSDDLKEWAVYSVTKAD